jgi:hypothetical protein
VVVAIDKELQVLHERVNASGEASGSASEPLEIMAQICVHCFHRIGLLLVGAHFIGSAIV